MPGMAKQGKSIVASYNSMNKIKQNVITTDKTTSTRIVNFDEDPHCFTATATFGNENSGLLCSYFRSSKPFKVRNLSRWSMPPGSGIYFVNFVKIK